MFSDSVLLEITEKRKEVSVAQFKECWKPLNYIGQVNWEGKLPNLHLPAR